MMFSNLIQRLQTWVGRLWGPQRNPTPESTSDIPPETNQPIQQSEEVKTTQPEDTNTKENTLTKESLTEHSATAEPKQTPYSNNKESAPEKQSPSKEQSQSQSRPLEKQSTKNSVSTSTNSEVISPNKLPRHPGKRPDNHMDSQKTRKRSKTNHIYQHQPELICRESLGKQQWQLVVIADDECQIKEIRQENQPLEKVNGTWPLISFIGNLSVDSEKQSTTIQLSKKDEPLIFKLSQNWQGMGRRVLGITTGHFIVIAPKEWKRTGHEPIAPKPCSDSNFLSHYFYQSKGKPANDLGGFKEYNGSLTRTGFELEGKRVFDDSEQGELFVGVAPKLVPNREVTRALVGEEGRKGWISEDFDPADQSLTDILDDRQGRFFIRVYNSENKRLDSGEFRYLRNLKGINIDSKAYTEDTLLIPSPAGYAPTDVAFAGTDNTSIVPTIDAKSNEYATIQKDETIKVEPHPDGDQLFCTLHPDNESIETVVRLPRIWWRLKHNEDEPDNWQDTPIEITRQECRDFADSGASIYLHLPPRVKSVSVGFDNQIDRIYRRKNIQSDIQISLQHFADYLQIEQQHYYKEALFKIKCGESIIPIVSIPADPVPKIISFTCEPMVATSGETVILYWNTENTEPEKVEISPAIGPVEASGSVQITIHKTTKYTLRLYASDMDDVTQDLTVAINHPQPQSTGKPIAYVKTGREWRQGKGFSRAEICATGLTYAKAKHQSISIDKRRRSKHQYNIGTLRRVTGV